jgi:hypothetical protein
MNRDREIIVGAGDRAIANLSKCAILRHLAPHEKLLK